MSGTRCEYMILHAGVANQCASISKEGNFCSKHRGSESAPVVKCEHEGCESYTRSKVARCVKHAGAVYKRRRQEQRAAALEVEPKKEAEPQPEPQPDPQPAPDAKEVTAADDIDTRIAEAITKAMAASKKRPPARVSTPRTVAKPAVLA